MKVSIRGARQLINKIRVRYNQFVSYTVNLEEGRLLDELVTNTPIDTGFARSRWKTYKGTDNGVSYTVLGGLVRQQQFTVYNDAKYITALNRGHSKQAPPFFIELTILRRGYIIKSISVIPKGE